MLGEDNSVRARSIRRARHRSGRQANVHAHRRREYVRRLALRSRQRHRRRLGTHHVPREQLKNLAEPALPERRRRRRGWRTLWLRRLEFDALDLVEMECERACVGKAANEHPLSEGAEEVVSVSRAYDWVGEVVKEPKTRNGIRTVPIPATLLPLLARMKEGTADDARVVPAMQKAGSRDAAAILRKHLAAAGVTHPRLSRDDSTFMPVGFRSFRDSGISWLAIEGVDLAKIQRRAGHDNISTTLGYVKAAEDFSRGGIGVPFGPLPEAMRPTVWPRIDSSVQDDCGPCGIRTRTPFGKGF